MPTPARIAPATRVCLTLLSRFFHWRHALVVVKPNLRLERYFILAVEIAVVVKAIALQISQYSGRPNRIANLDTEILQRGTPCPIFKNTMQYLPSAIDGQAPYAQSWHRVCHGYILQSELCAGELALDHSGASPSFCMRDFCGPREAHVSRVASKPVKIIRQFESAPST
jgi:hypothetical protein